MKSNRSCSSKFLYICCFAEKQEEKQEHEVNNVIHLIIQEIKDEPCHVCMAWCLLDDILDLDMLGIGLV